jgi:tetratricopeptide (TPR) repeat protein
MSKRPPVRSSPRPSTANDEAVERAVLALRMQRPAEAERVAAEVLRANRGNLRAAEILGQALLMQYRAAEAIEPLERAARRSKDPAIETLLATALAAAGRGEEAIAQLRQTMARLPPYPPAFLEYGRLLGKMGRFEEAIAALDGAIAFVPDAVDLQRELATLHLKRNDRIAARAILLRALEMAAERPDLLAVLAQVMLLDGEYADAADTFRRVVALRPGDALARADLGRCLLEMGQREAGEASIRQATRDRPQLLNRAIMSLSVASRGRFFLRPSAAVKFLRGQNA